MIHTIRELSIIVKEIIFEDSGVYTHYYFYNKDNMQVGLITCTPLCITCNIDDNAHRIEIEMIRDFCTGLEKLYYKHQ